MREWEHYVSMSNRNERAAQLRRDGARNVRKRSSRNQCISPSYIEDYTGHRSPNGFGGAADTFISVLYTVEWDY